MQPEGLDPMVIPVTASVSLWREAWRIFQRVLAGALPGAWRTTVAWWRWLNRIGRAIGRPFARHDWLFWLLWLVLSGAAFYLLTIYPQALATVLAYLGTALPPDEVSVHLVRAFVAILGPPTLAVGLWLIALLVVTGAGLLIGGLRGAWRSFFR